MISGVPGGDFGWPADFPPAEVQPLPPDLIAPVQVGPRELSPAVETKIQLLSEGMAQLSPACQAAVIDHALRELGYLPPQFDAILGGNDKVVKLLSSYGSSDSASGAQRIALMRARTWLREYVFVLRPSSAEPAGPAPLMNPAPGPDQAGGSNPR